MLTIQRTTSETLDTPEAIAAHLAAEWRARSEVAPFHAGDVVRATSREGLPPDMMIGNVGAVLLCDPAAGPHAVMCAHRSGMIVQAQVPTANLETIAA